MFFAKVYVLQVFCDATAKATTASELHFILFYFNPPPQLIP